ncbi:MAG: HNH endonuclease signature motif containing protein [Nanoarchaeota archaeon]|nr:HNH endonuclease signature motif containing protein [Nanoarchaeota archaeon]
MKKNIPAHKKRALQLLKTIKNKRAKIVIEHILNKGRITTGELEKTYGYKHPPRAARDVREAGIPLETFKVKSSEGRTIAAYRFGNLEKVQKKVLEGRKVFPKEFKKQLYSAGNGRCSICNGEFEERYLQIDHRVPYEISKYYKAAKEAIKDYMLLCGSCNRAKSWSCEHCKNWRTNKKPEICMHCYWGNPYKYEHIALREIRRLDLQWQKREIKYFEALRKESLKYKIKLPDFVKELIEDAVNKSKEVK